MPERIQKSRQRTWRKDHPDAIDVSRPNWLGNPFAIYEHCKGKNGDWGVKDLGRLHAPIGHGWTKLGAINAAVSAYKAEIDHQYPEGSTARHILANTLRGHDLVCWCPLDRPCHADVLLELANTESSATP